MAKKIRSRGSVRYMESIRYWGGPLSEVPLYMCIYICFFSHSPVFPTSSHTKPCEAQLTTGSREDDKDLDDHLCIVLHSLPLLVDHHLEEDANIFIILGLFTFRERPTNLNFSSHHIELHVCTCICMSMCCKTPL